jgi:hypothetical protein
LAGTTSPPKSKILGCRSNLIFFLSEYKEITMKHSLLVAALVAVALTACGKKEEAKPAAAPAPAPVAAPAPAAPATDTAKPADAAAAPAAAPAADAAKPADAAAAPAAAPADAAKDAAKK